MSATSPAILESLAPAAGAPGGGHRPLQSGRGFFQRLARRRNGLAGLVVAGAFLLVGIVGPSFVPNDPLRQFAGEEIKPPSLQFLLGTDSFGRDVLSRVVVGARLSLLIGLAGVALGATIGISLGFLAAYAGGLTEVAIMRPIDGLLAFPSILTGIVVATILGPGLSAVTVTVGIVNVPVFARLARAALLAEKNREYVLASRSIGASGARIVVRHILPNTLVALITQAVLAMALSVVLEASLSFLGLGIARPEPSWGAMLDDSRSFLRNAPWMALAPGICLVVLLVGLTWLSDAISDALGPRYAHVL